MHRHGYKGRKFGRERDQRRALLKGLATSLVIHGKIETTLPKAKETLRYTEKLITKAKKGDLHNRRQIIAKLGNIDAANKLVDVIAPQLSNRNSGHLRVERTRIRRGDAAESATLGRLSAKIATFLTGKNKPTYTPHTDGGDYVIVINAEKVKVTGNKEEAKMYYRHSGFPGGLSEASLKELREKNAAMIIEKAVYGMLPKNKLQADRMKRLKVYVGVEHNHAAQKPEKVEVK